MRPPDPFIHHQPSVPAIPHRTLDAIDFISRCHIRLCLLIVSTGLAIYLGTVISMLTRAEPLPPFPSPSCPASNPPTTTSPAFTRSFKF